MGAFDNAIFYLDALGLTDVILPFILLFTVLYAILMKVALFKEGEGPSKRYNSIIALAITLITIIPHITGAYPLDRDPVIIINTFLPGAVIITVALLIFLMLLGFLGAKKEATQSPLVALAGIVAIIALVMVLWRALYPTGSPNWMRFLDDPNLQAVVVIILIMGIVIYFVTSTPGDKAGRKGWFQSMQDLFGNSGGGKQ